MNPIVHGAETLWALCLRELLRFARERSSLYATLARPTLWLIVLGSGMRNAFRQQTGVPYAAYMLPGVVVMTILFGGLFSGVSTVWDREFGFLKEVLVAPIDRSAVAVGKALGGATQASIQGLVLLVLAPLVHVPLSLRTVALIVPVTFLLAFALSSMGVAIASKMRSMQGFQMIMNLLMMPIFFLSGALFPLHGLPGWMTALTRVDPASYGIDPLRRVVLGGAPAAFGGGAAGMTWFGRVLPIAVELVVLTAFGFLMLAIAIRNFRVPD